MRLIFYFIFIFLISFDCFAEDLSGVKDRLRLLIELHEEELINEEDYAKKIVENSRALADSLTTRGLRMVSGGTDTHLCLVDLRPLGIKGNKAVEVLSRVGIVVNKNVIPNDPESPLITSGLRLGSAAVTSRGMGRQEMWEIGQIIARVLAAPDEKGLLRDK